MAASRSKPVLAAVLSLAVSTASFAGLQTQGSQPFDQASVGQRTMIDGERPIALYGVLLATDANPDTSTDEFVEAFLQEYADQFGVDDPDLVLKDKITIRDGKFTVYTYTQRIEGLHVYTSVVKIPVLLGPTEKISYVGMHLVPTPTSPLPPDVITDADAIAVGNQS